MEMLQMRIKMRLYFLFTFIMIILCCVLPIYTQEFPVEYITALPDAAMTREVPDAHAYIVEQHNSMCVAVAVTRAGEKMLEYYGKHDENYVTAWTHHSGRNVADKYTEDQVGMYGSDAALAIETIGFLPASMLQGHEKNEWNSDKISKLGWDDNWDTVFERYKDKTDKYPIAQPRNVNEIVLCLTKGLPVLFLSSAQWRVISCRNVDGQGHNRMEFATTQYNTKGAHVVCLRDYFTLPYFKDGRGYPMEYCNLVNSHGDAIQPLKTIWLDIVQRDDKFSCFVILPAKGTK
jgi:hypothetical protein